METKNKEEKLEVLRNRNGNEYACYVESEGLSGGLVVWWKEQEKVKILGKGKILIDMEVEDMNYGEKYMLFWVYGPMDYEERQEVWKIICNKGRDIRGP